MVMDLMDELGIGYDRHGEPAAPLTDRRWSETELGTVLLQAYMEKEVASRRRDLERTNAALSDDTCGADEALELIEPFTVGEGSKTTQLGSSFQGNGKDDHW